MNLEQIKYQINIEVESGLHIGAGDSVIEIGGIDNKVIRDAITNEPFIPGSSLKGKMRYLLEEYYRDNSQKLDEIKVLFGVSGDDKTVKHRLTRLQFVDLYLTDASKNHLNKTLGSGVYTVVKYENSINRETGKADNPRPTERVPKGAKFRGYVILNVIKSLDDNKDLFNEILEKGVELLNSSYLGGNGSRGYGKVAVSIERQ